MPLTLVARVSGKPKAELKEAIHMTVADSNVKEVNRLVVLATITVGALTVPKDSVLPVSGGNTPFTRLVKEAMPGLAAE